VPVIGVAKAGWTLDQLKARAHDSLEKHGGVDPAAFEKLSGLLRYVDGDYQHPATFKALGKELKTAERPAHYLASPPTMFEAVFEQLIALWLFDWGTGHRRKTVCKRPAIGTTSESGTSPKCR
jgi:glucose-6-phosphate 1-dehydrogenase